jgi:hypothetical protein
MSQTGPIEAEASGAGTVEYIGPAKFTDENERFWPTLLAEANIKLQALLAAPSTANGTKEIPELDVFYILGATLVVSNEFEVERQEFHDDERQEFHDDAQTPTQQETAKRRKEFKDRQEEFNPEYDPENGITTIGTRVRTKYDAPTGLLRYKLTPRDGENRPSIIIKLFGERLDRLKKRAGQKAGDNQV